MMVSGVSATEAMCLTTGRARASHLAMTWALLRAGMQVALQQTGPT